MTVATNMAGRGVDIILGGNPELLARHEAVAAGVDLETEEGQAELARLPPSSTSAVPDEGEQVRELGRPLRAGSERHESRRIDNQLRGRPGRQGDPGESRFYLSLEDELMRLFATGAMNWVMGRALPEDVPIEAKMVTKAIERAQNTVEGRNSEIRKEVLKYDEVMNEQRKVIYARRLQVIDGEDLQEHTEELLDVDDRRPWWSRRARATSPRSGTSSACSTEVAAVLPDRVHGGGPGRGATTRDQVAESLRGRALDFYERHSASLPGGEEQARQIEREVMLQVIDQRWRDHLAEMDYLREGINLRAMGQQDPLVAWQRDGFEMFGQLMDAIDDDYLRYVLHVEAVAEPAAEPDLARAVYEAADDPVADSSALAGQLLADQGVDVPPPRVVPAADAEGRRSGPAGPVGPAAAVSGPAPQVARRR